MQGYQYYKCLDCGKVFASEPDIAEHVKRVHEASTRETELFTRAQASDYSRKLAYREARNYPRLTALDVVVMFFVGALVTVMFAFIVGAL